jgi:hypothetical protein
MRPIQQHRRRVQRKSKIVLISFLEAPFLRGFYFAKMLIENKLLVFNAQSFEFERPLR